MFSNDTFLDFRPPKSPKWFFSLRSDAPPVPLVAGGARLGNGAQIVRTPAEALSNVPSTPRLPHKSSLDQLSTPPLLPLRHQISVDLKHKSLKVNPNRNEHLAVMPPRIDHIVQPTSMFDPFGPSRVRPNAVPPFTALLLSKTTTSCPTSNSNILIRVEFGFSLERPPRNDSVVINWEDLARAGGNLAQFVASQLDETPKPDLTDGSSDSDSDYDLDSLLRDEYLKSMYVTTPSQPELTTPPLGDPGRRRAATRNQYIQLRPFPSPLSPLTSLSIRRNAPRLQVEEHDGGGRITALVVLLARDASSYHILGCRLATGKWPKMEGTRRQRLEEELLWLGMMGMLRELQQIPQQSLVRRGGVGYI